MTEQKRIRPKVAIYCLHQLLGSKIAERLLRDQFDVEINFETDPEKVKSSFKDCDVAIVEIGVNRENIDIFPMCQSDAKRQTERRPIMIAIADRDQNLKVVSEFLHMDKIYPLPIDLRLLSENISALLRARGISAARKHVRSKINLDVKMRLLLPNTDFAMTATNISLGGFFVEGNAGTLFKGVGDQVTFVLHPGNRLHRGIKGTGTVRWVQTRSPNGKNIGFGIKFGTLYGVTEKQLKEFIMLYQQDNWLTRQEDVPQNIEE